MDQFEQADQLLAERLRALRVEKGMSLDALAQTSGVSRATLSRLENGEVSPTAQVLGKLCAAHGLTMSRLLYMVEQRTGAKLTPFEQPVWRDPGNGFVRRLVSPPAPGFAGEVLRCQLRPGTVIEYDSVPCGGMEQIIYMLEGELAFTADHQIFELKAGDSLKVRLFGQTGFRTPAHSGAEYMLFIV